MLSLCNLDSNQTLFPHNDEQIINQLKDGRRNQNSCHQLLGLDGVKNLVKFVFSIDDKSMKILADLVAFNSKFLAYLCFNVLVQQCVAAKLQASKNT